MEIIAETDDDTGITVVYLGDNRRVAETVEYPGVIVDRDAQGKPISVEILAPEAGGLGQAIETEGLADHKAAIMQAISSVS